MQLGGPRVMGVNGVSYLFNSSTWCCNSIEQTQLGGPRVMGVNGVTGLISVSCLIEHINMVLQFN